MVKPAESPLSISEHNAGACERAYAARYLSEQMQARKALMS